MLRHSAAGACVRQAAGAGDSAGTCERAARAAEARRVWLRALSRLTLRRAVPRAERDADLRHRAAVDQEGQPVRQGDLSVNDAPRSRRQTEASCGGGRTRVAVRVLKRSNTCRKLLLGCPNGWHAEPQGGARTAAATIPAAPPLDAAQRSPAPSGLLPLLGVTSQTRRIKASEQRSNQANRKAKGAHYAVSGNGCRLPLYMGSSPPVYSKRFIFQKGM